MDDLTSGIKQNLTNQVDDAVQKAVHNITGKIPGDTGDKIAEDLISSAEKKFGVKPTEHNHSQNTTKPQPKHKKH